MALTKIKLNELTPKADPVLADSIVISDSENSGKGALVEITDLQTLIGGGGGGGAVDSVAGKTGVVTLDASDIAETAALKIMTADERTKLTGIAEGAEVNTVDSVAGKTGDVTLDADDVATTASKLWMSDTQSAKLTGIAENANNYTHPASHPQSMIEGLSDALAAKAPLASPALTGTPTAPTAATGTNTTQIATTEFVQDAVDGATGGADSVKLTGDQSIGGTKTFTTSPVLPTPTAGDNSTKGATTAFVTAAVAGVSGGAVDSVAGKTGVVTLDADDVSPTSSKLWMSDTQSAKLSGIAENANNYTHPASHPQSMIEGLSDALAAKAPLASPALTGTPTAPTPAAGTNTTQIATTAFCNNFNQKWSYSYGGGATNAVAWTMHAFGTNGTLTLPLASSVASGVQVAAIVVAGGATVTITRSGSDQFVTPTGLATSYTLRGNGSSIVLVRATSSAWACVGAPDAMINAATASAIYDLPVTRTGTVSPGIDAVLFETGVLDPAWYDQTHVLNVSFFAKNEGGIPDSTIFRFQLYDESTSTAYTVASITGDTDKSYIMQASLYRASAGSVNCNANFGFNTNSGNVSLAAGSYKLRVVCNSLLSIVFYAAQVRFTK